MPRTLPIIAAAECSDSTATVIGAMIIAPCRRRSWNGAEIAKLTPGGARTAGRFCVVRRLLVVLIGALFLRDPARQLRSAGQSSDLRAAHIAGLAGSDRGGSHRFRRARSPSPDGMWPRFPQGRHRRFTVPPLAVVGICAGQGAFTSPPEPWCCSCRIIWPSGDGWHPGLHRLAASGIDCGGQEGVSRRRAYITISLSICAGLPFLCFRTLPRPICSPVWTRV